MNLGFFTSYNCGIGLWSKIGTLYREMTLYRVLAKDGVDVHVFAIEREKDVADMLKGAAFSSLTVHCLYPDWIPFNRLLALLLMPFFLFSNRRIGKTMDILKTNQGHAGIHVCLAAMMWGRPYISRSGYVLNEQLKNRDDYSIKDVIQAWLERITMRNAAVCFVPSEYHVEWCRKYMVCKRVECMPNSVDTDVFKPSRKRRENRAVAVGRVVQMKRQDMILRACKLTNIPLRIVGDGPFLDHVKVLAKEINAELIADGRVDNSQLPKFYANSLIYIIASEYEGCPKTLIEAMSCGCVCIGTKNPGIQNQIVDGVNGLLVDENEDAIAGAISRVLADAVFAEKLSDGARRYAVDHFSIEKLAQKEVELLSW